MDKINFTKMVASGNDFVVIESPALPAGRPDPRPQTRNLSILAQRICDRKYGAGADGLIFLEKSKIADIKMRIFNADGSEAQMCGNGARCAALYCVRKQKTENRKQKKIKIDTKAGIIAAEVKGETIKIKLTPPKDIKLDIPIKVNNRNIKVNFIDTGVPHAVIFVEGLDEIDIVNLGRLIRFHKAFIPEGTNADFVELLKDDSIKVRTYERGVEDETLACGTGSVASALLYAMRYTSPAGRQARYVKRINVHTKSGEVLKVYFDKINNGFGNVYLQGKAEIVYTGEGINV